MIHALIYIVLGAVIFALLIIIIIFVRALKDLFGGW